MLLKMAAFFCTGGSRNLDLFILYFLLSLCWNLYSLSYDQNNLGKLEGKHLFFVLQQPPCSYINKRSVEERCYIQTVHDNVLLCYMIMYYYVT